MSINVNAPLDQQAFLEGYKPALLTSSVLSEPRITSKPNLVFPHRNTVLYFQDEFDKELFEKNGVITISNKQGNISFKDYKHDAMGYVLGFPPKSVEFFMKSNKLSKATVNNLKVCVRYHGIRFVTSRFTVLEDIIWLWKVRPVPEHIRGITTIDELGQSLPYRKMYKVEDFCFQSLFYAEAEMRNNFRGVGRYT